FHRPDFHWVARESSFSVPPSSSVFSVMKGRIPHATARFTLSFPPVRISTDLFPLTPQSLPAISPSPRFAAPAAHANSLIEKTLSRGPPPPGGSFPFSGPSRQEGGPMASIKQIDANRRNAQRS